MPSACEFEFVNWNSIGSRIVFLLDSARDFRFGMGFPFDCWRVGDSRGAMWFSLFFSCFFFLA